MTSNCDKGKQIKSTRNFLFPRNKGQFKQSLFVITNSLVGVEIIELVSKEEIGNFISLTQLLEMNE